MRRIAVLIALLAVLLSLGGAAMVWRAWSAAAREEALRHELVAERVFDELERELNGVVEREESRSFLEYRYFYIPERQVASTVGLARSPLSEVPEDPTVLGYFQLDADGTLHNPVRPRRNELEFAVDNDLWPSSAETEQLEAEVRALVARVQWEGDTRPVAAAPQKRAAQTGSAGLVQSLNRAVRTRSSRVEKGIQQTSATNVQTFVDADQNLDALLEPPEPLQSVDADQIDVEVTPLQGSVLDPEHLVLHRTVRIGGDSFRQGLVVRTRELARSIEAAVLDRTELEPWVTLTWAGAPPRSRYAFEHRFAPPFQDMAVTASLARIPGESGGGRYTAVALFMLLGLVTLVGAVALYRMVAAQVEFAERRNDFVAAVSHELKTPLTAIRMSAEILRDGMAPSEDRKQQYYATITAESERLSRLIGNVLELARLERGSRAMHTVAGQVEPILDRVAEILGPHARERGFELVVEVPEALPPVSVDPDALLQVLVNLVDNALKFSREAEDKRIVVVATATGAWVRLAVRDHGPGVPSRQLAKVFQPFFRGERELTRTTKGTGIGLALVQGLVTRMGGSVRARNHPEGGFEVAILLAAAAG